MWCVAFCWETSETTCIRASQLLVHSSIGRATVSGTVGSRFNSWFTPNAKTGASYCFENGLMLSSLMKFMGDKAVSQSSQGGEGWHGSKRRGLAASNGSAGSALRDVLSRNVRKGSAAPQRQRSYRTSEIRFWAVSEDELATGCTQASW